jgi:PncC family amidohydrolase
MASEKAGARALAGTLIEERIGELMRARHLTLGLAESCTGGLIGHRLTNVAGSSAFLIASIVAYAYEAKERLLGVPHDMLVCEGAVSEPVVLAMARGARRVLSVDISLAVTGIAGPGGATPSKPVGLTYIALAAQGVERVQRHVWNGDRIANKEQSAEAALRLLLDYLERDYPEGLPPAGGQRDAKP